MAGDLTIPSSRRTYGLVVLVVVMLLLGGLLVPLVFGERGTEVGLSGSSEPEPSFDGGFAAAPTDGVSPGEGAVDPGALPPGAAPQDPAAAPGSAPAPVTAPGSGPAGGGPSGPAGPRTASDVGVTASTIKVGVVYLDLEAVEPLGLSIENFDVETQKRSFQAYFDEINATGGIHGRRIEAVYVRNDPLDTGAARARCVKLANDEKVFAVLGWVTDEAACLAKEFQRPTFAYRNYLAAAYRESANYLVSSLPSLERTAMNWAGALDQLRLLHGRKVGIVASETTDEKAGADALEATLVQLGHQITYRTRLSSNENTANSQLPIEVQKMRRAGVDTVLFPTNFLLARLWVENAESQGWTPQYHASDIGQLSVDDLVERMPDSYDGAIAFTNNSRTHRAKEPEPAPDRLCRETYNRRSGDKVDYGEVHPIYNSCPLMDIFKAALAKVGPGLTRANAVGAVQSLGRLPLMTYSGGNFAPGKTDYNNDVRPTRWHLSCRCHQVIGPVMTGRF